MSNTTNNPAAPTNEKKGPSMPQEGETPPTGAPPGEWDNEAQNPSDFDDPMAGSPDRQPGDDSPRQRPLTDNKAGG